MAVKVPSPPAVPPKPDEAAAEVDAEALIQAKLAEQAAAKPADAKAALVARLEQKAAATQSPEERLLVKDAPAPPDGAPPEDASAIKSVIDPRFNGATKYATLPTISLNKGETVKIVRESEYALIKKGVPVFSRGGDLVYPAIEEMPATNGRKTKVAILRRFTTESLLYELASSACFVTWRVNKKSGQAVSSPADAPRQIASMLLQNNRHWTVDRVTGVITTPTLREDGSLLAGTTAHYDATTQLYYVPDIQLPSIPDQPTRDEALAALDVLTELLSEFPFVSELDRAVALSGILTVLIRGSIPVAPMHLIRAHTAGTGKSYLIDLISTIATGQGCPAIGWTDSEEENEKRLGAKIMSGVQIILLDNAEHDFGGAALCQVTERPRMSYRPLGRSEILEFDCRTSVFGNGNNVGFTADMTRRGVICRMDAGVERPELREFQQKPLDRVLADRGRYVAAGLTVIRAYIMAGSPAVYSQLGSYAAWSAMVRGPLLWLGQPDPVASMEPARVEDFATIDIRELLGSGWLENDQWYKTKEIISVSQDAISDDFRKFLQRIAGDLGGVSAQRLGLWLRKHEGKPFGGQRLVADRTGKEPRYRIQTMQEGTRS